MIAIVLSSMAALSLLATGGYAVFKKRTAANIVLFFVAVLLSGIEIFDQVSLQADVDGGIFRSISLYLEALLPGALLLLSVVNGRIQPLKKSSKFWLSLAAGLALFPVVLLLLAGNDLYYSPDFKTDRVLFLGDAGYWYYLGLMVSFIIALVNVEATFSATRGMDRYRAKFEAFGIMSLLAVLIFYYSQALLYRTIDMNLAPVRSSVFIIASLLIVYSRAVRGNGVSVSVSRQIFYRSMTLLSVGVYLIILGAIGEGMRYFDVAFGKNLAIVIAFAGGVLLLAVLFSEKARRKTKVYIHKHFFANKHDYREEWIKFTGRFASCATLRGVQESVLAAYQETFGLKGGSLYLAGRVEKKFVRATGRNMPEGPMDVDISDELLMYFATRERVLSLADGEYRLSGPELSAFRQAGAWLVVPMINGGRIEGLIVLGEQLVAQDLIYDDYDLMKVMARQAAQAVANLRLSEENMEMRAIAAVSRISAFVIHDLKNLTSGLSLVVDNAEEHIGNPDFQKDAIATVRSTLEKMKGLMQRLKTIPEKMTLITRVEDVDRLSRETVDEISKMRPGRSIVYAGVYALSCVDGEEIKKVIVNLVQNAFEASDRQAAVNVETQKENGSVAIRVIDNGTGMTEDFVKNHLFRPFRTTKEKGLGIGLFQCRQIVEAHGGRLEAKSEVGKGTVFTVFLPAADIQT